MADRFPRPAALTTVALTTVALPTAALTAAALTTAALTTAAVLTLVATPPAAAMPAPLDTAAGPPASPTAGSVTEPTTALGVVPGAVAPASGTWPLSPQPEVVRGFDPPDVRWGSGHRGVDLLGSVGAAVRAALAGRVTFAGAIAGRGVVVVDHGGMRTTYEPLVPAVHRGDEVGAGEVIGHLTFVGSHCSPGACLHWGLIAGDTYLDPLTLVGGPRPVRLYPTEGFGTGVG
jgi:murein DD-endopeptidase MepM/ murein hydrolase activator NlpD